MNKNEMIRIVGDMIAAPSCCQEMKDAGRKWLDAIGTAGENAAWDALCKEAKAEKCKALAVHAREIKSKGAKWCDCPACAACAKILGLD